MAGHMKYDGYSGNMIVSDPFNVSFVYECYWHCPCEFADLLNLQITVAEPTSDPLDLCKTDCAVSMSVDLEFYEWNGDSKFCRYKWEDLESTPTRSIELTIADSGDGDGTFEFWIRYYAGSNPCLAPIPAYYISDWIIPFTTCDATYTNSISASPCAVSIVLTKVV